MPQRRFILTYTILNTAKHILFNVYITEQTFWTVIIFITPTSFTGKKNPGLQMKFLVLKAIHQV